MHVSAAVNSQNLSISLKNAELKQVFKELESLTSYTFLYKSKEVNSVKDVSVNVAQSTIDEILKICLIGTSLTYELDGNLILIKKQAEVTFSAEQKKKTIKGTVKDSQGYPLPGVSIVVKGTQTGISSDMDGKFELSVDDKPGVVLVFSFVGMKTQQVKIAEKAVLNVVMKDDAEQLEEVVVTTGYQQIDRKLFTGSATVLKADDAKVAGVADVGRMLEGKVAGVSVQNVSGTFGAAPKIRVRGASSIYGDTKPLWVVDGVVLEDVVDVTPDQLSSGDAATLISS